jgi:hypothetical protein
MLHLFSGKHLPVGSSAPHYVNAPGVIIAFTQSGPTSKSRSTIVSPQRGRLDDSQQTPRDQPVMREGVPILALHAMEQKRAVGRHGLEGSKVIGQRMVRTFRGGGGPAMGVRATNPKARKHMLLVLVLLCHAGTKQKVVCKFCGLLRVDSKPRALMANQWSSSRPCDRFDRETGGRNSGLGL